MTTRQLVQLFLPPVYYKIKKRIHHPKLIESPLPQIKHNSDKIIVIGNGPSLNKSIELYKDEILKHDRICVNFFGSSDFYEELKPNIYVFADPAFFWIPDNQKESMKRLFNNIISKTTWPLQIIIPSGAKGAPMEAILLTNKNIKIDYYNSDNQEIGRMTKFEAWDKNLISAPAQTVLNTCIYLGLFWNFPEIYLIGADTSFLESLLVDQETNELYTADKHFYNNDCIYADKTLFDSLSRRKINSDLAEEIRTIYVIFKLYKEMAEYAQYKGLKVYNACEYSWIDAFERKKLK